MSFAAHLADVQPLLHRYGYGAVFVSVSVEGFGIPAPGQTLLVAGALLAARGELSLDLLLTTTATASLLGGLIGWMVGWFGGHRLLTRIASGSRLARIETLFARWGRGVVLLGRFVDGARQLNAIAAGALGMPLPSFFLWNALGALLWTGFWGLGAYWLGRDFRTISHLFHQARPVVVIAVVTVVALGIIWLVRGNQAQKAATPRGHNRG